MKGLQKLERIKKLSCAWDVENDEFKDAVEIVPNAFETIEKELKALEIIKNSGYISIDIMLSQNYITRKEYDLLKEVLL